MFFTIANHNSAKNPKGFINYNDVEFSDIPQMVTSGYAYSAGKFKDEHRKNDNWIGYVDVIILDIDDGCTIVQAQEIFRKYEHFIITTRSHQKEKNGLVCDRFRVFIHIDTTINDPLIMDSLMNKLMNMYPFLDSSCRDRGRYFFSSEPDSKIIYNSGIKFNAIMPVIVIKTHLEAIKEVKTLNVSSNDIYRLNELTMRWEDSKGNVLDGGYSDDGVNYDAKLKGIKIFMDTNYYDSNKHHCLVSCVYMMRNDGFNDDHIVNFLFDECSDRIQVAIGDIVNIVKRLK